MRYSTLRDAIEQAIVPALGEYAEHYASATYGYAVVESYDLTAA